jgi:hypothetical protein
MVSQLFVSFYRFWHGKITPERGWSITATGDAFLKSTDSLDPDIVIIDTEGNDCRVFAGLADLIQRKCPIILFEHIFETTESIQATLPHRYYHFTVDDKSGELLPGLDRSRGHNSAFVPQT